MADNSFDSEGDNIRDDKLTEEPEYLKKMLTTLKKKIDKYNRKKKDLERENAERDKSLEQIQKDIEKLQMDILFKNLNIEKSQNILREMKGEEKTEAQQEVEEYEEKERIGEEISYELEKYMNRIIYAKTFEMEQQVVSKGKSDAILVKFYREDPTDQDFGKYAQASSSYQIFGLSQKLTFKGLKELCAKRWNIELKDYCLTDSFHHDMVLMDDVPVVQFLSYESPPQWLFILRKKNITMTEMLLTQKEQIEANSGQKKDQRVKEDYRRIFETLRASKPGIKTYEPPSEDNPQPTMDKVDGGIFNITLLFTIMILMIVSLFAYPIQPVDERIIHDYIGGLAVVDSYPSFDEFLTKFNAYVADSYQDGTPYSKNMIPIGFKRIVMVKMIPQICSSFLGISFCSYESTFTDGNIDKTSLNETDVMYRDYKTVPDDEVLDLRGSFSEFRGDGFIVDIDATESVTLNYVDNLVNTKLKKNIPGGYFYTYTRAVIVVTQFMEPNRLFLLQRAIMFELSSTGIVEVSERKAFFTFEVDGVENTAITNNAKILRALLALTIIGYGLNIIRHVFAKSGNSKKKYDFSKLFRPANLIKIVIMILVIVYYAYVFPPKLSKTEILGSTKFVSFEKYGSRRETALTCLTMATFLHSLVMIRSCVFSNTISIFLAIFASSYKDFLGFLVIFFAVFFGFAFIWWVAFSPYHENLINFTDSAFQIFQFFSSGNRVIVNQLLSLNESWAIILIVVTCFIVFIQLDAIMMSVIQENVRYLYLVNENQAKQEAPFKETLDKFLKKVNGWKSKLLSKLKCKKKV